MVASLAARQFGFEHPPQAAECAMKGEIGLIEWHVRPDHLKEFVFRDAPLRPVKQKGEHRLRLPRARFRAAPARDALAVALHTERPQRPDTQLHTSR